MKNLYKSKYAEHYYDAETNTLHSNWFEETKNMKGGDFKKEIEEWLRVSEEVKPNKIYDYCVNFIYPINNEEQVWMAHTLNPGWIGVGVKKYAHVVPQEFITNLSVDLMFDEFFLMKLENQFEIKHFADEDTEKAKKWLFEEEL